MGSFAKRLDALEAERTDPTLVGMVLAREADVTAWLLSAGGDRAEKAAMFGHIFEQVDGRSKGLPHHHNGGEHAQH